MKIQSYGAKFLNNISSNLLDDLQSFTKMYLAYHNDLQLLYSLKEI